MTKEQVQYWIEEGYHIFEGGKPYRIEGDVWEWLDMQDESASEIFILEDLVKWSEEELKSLEG